MLRGSSTLLSKLNRNVINSNNSVSWISSTILADRLCMCAFDRFALCLSLCSTKVFVFCSTTKNNCITWTESWQEKTENLKMKHRQASYFSTCPRPLWSRRQLRAVATSLGSELIHRATWSSCTSRSWTSGKCTAVSGLRAESWTPAVPAALVTVCNVCDVCWRECYSRASCR